MNPYTGATFLEFFQILFARLFYLEVFQLATDEIQILVLVGVAASSALVGVFLVLKKMTMLANALSHTILLGIVIAYILTMQDIHSHYQTIDVTTMLIASVIMGVITAFLTQFLTNTARLQEDASTGLVFTSLFALGIVLVTLLTRNAHIGTEIVMGNVDALHIDDCKLVYAILGMNIVLFTLFFKEYKIISFDGSLAKALGISTLFFNYLLMVQVSATCIGAFRAVGVLMVLAFITGPPLIARFLTHNLKTMAMLSVVIGSGASIFGVAISRHMLSVYGLALTTGGIVVCVIVLLFVVISGIQLCGIGRSYLLKNHGPQKSS